MTARDSVAGRSAIAGQRRDREWADITSRAPGRDRRPERHELAGVEVARDRASTTASPWCVSLATCAEPREVLDRGGHAGRLEAADHRRAVPPDRRRVVAERADPERRVRPGSWRGRRPGA